MSEIEIIKNYGEFKAGNIVNVETSIALILSKKGYCKIIKTISNDMVRK